MNEPQIILIAPNVGEQMGGEAMKALQIFKAIQGVHPGVLQITHERNEAEVAQRLKLPNVHFIRDTWFSRFLWKSRVLRGFLDYWFSVKAVALAETLAGPGVAVIHQTEPNSPVSPRAFSARHVNVLGPINGNIYYPAAFRQHESTSARIRRVLHMPLQELNRLFFRGMLKADVIFTAGGARTEVSLLRRGCSPARLVHTVDCGVDRALFARPRIAHAGPNLRFVHFGRLVFHKGTALVIESLRKTRLPVTLDIVGRGPELEHCKQLATQLGVADRVHFLDWYERHDQLLDALAHYRGVVLPTLEDANGIVIQEAMALGLPPICLDWGGPQLLIDDGVSGFLVQPTTRDAITTALAERMDRLAEDGALAESMSMAARNTALGWEWSGVIREWLKAYPQAKKDLG